MTDGQQVVEKAIGEAGRLQKLLRGKKSSQVRLDEDKQIIKATAHSWFRSHRTPLASILGDDQIKPIDDVWRGLLTAAANPLFVANTYRISKKLKRDLLHCNRNTLFRLQARLRQAGI